MKLPGEALVIKLWDTLAEKGVGSLLSPWHEGRVGRARIEVRKAEIIQIAQAEKDAADIRSGRKQLSPDGTLLLTSQQQIITPNQDERIDSNLDLSKAIQYCNRFSVDAETRLEFNSSKAILFAEEQLANDTQIPPEDKLEDDWLFIWREYAGKVSTEDLQRLWGSVLAGEIKAPGKYTIRTLEFLKTLSKSEADMIAQLAPYVIDGCVIRSQGKYLESQGLSFTKLLALQEIGIISGVESVGISSVYKSNDKERFFLVLGSQNKALVIESDNPSKTLEMVSYKLTVVGDQILGLGSFEPDVEYMRLVGKDCLKKGFTVKIADWRSVSERQWEYFNEEEIKGDTSAN